jgi:vesicle transport through interaction with t-SNAREs protein 1
MFITLQRRQTAIVPKNSDREELLGGFNNGDDSQSDFDASTMDQRQRLLSGTERLGQSSRRLEDSHRLALETEGIGINILSTLKGQRETMVRARDTVSFYLILLLLLLL